MSILSQKQYYVYTLARPDGRVFYVGKGKGRRSESHLDEARKGDCYCRKCKIIRHIWAARKEVLIEHVFETGSVREALNKERELIQGRVEQHHFDL